MEKILGEVVFVSWGWELAIEVGMERMIQRG
jgi:hypothetical protein